MLLNARGILDQKLWKSQLWISVFSVYVAQSHFQQSFLAAHIIYRHTPESDYIAFTVSFSSER